MCAKTHYKRADRLDIGAKAVPDWPGVMASCQVTKTQVSTRQNSSTSMEPLVPRISDFKNCEALNHLHPVHDQIASIRGNSPRAQRVFVDARIGNRHIPGDETMRDIPQVRTDELLRDQ